MQRASGSVARVERKRGPVWYARYRLPSGRQGQKLLDPERWLERPPRPSPGPLAEKAMAR